MIPTLTIISINLSMLLLTSSNNQQTTLWGMAPHMGLLPLMSYHLTPYPSNLSYVIPSLNSQFDNISYWLILLTLMLMPPLSMNSLSPKILMNWPSLLNPLIIIMTLLLTMAFSTNNMLMFYILFESTLPPIIMMIMLWGYQPERLNASLYMLFYTMTMSLPLLVSILFIFHKKSLNLEWFPTFMNTKIINIILMLAFLVKIPLYSLHLWLPKAHVEAPVTGSMILAGTLLKLGIYGVIRMSTIISSSPILQPHTLIIAMTGGVLTACLCTRQPDLKALIAYSSISHMGVATAGLLSFNSFGWKSASLLMLSHGFASPMMFSIANSLYENSKTRSLLLMSGLKSLHPSFPLWMFLAIMANSGAPPTSNFMSEILAMTSLMMMSKSLSPLLMLIPILTMLYSSILYLQPLHYSPPTTFKALQPRNNMNTNHLILLSPLFLTPLMLLNML